MVCALCNRILAVSLIPRLYVEYEPPRQRTLGVRPRRSASLSEAGTIMDDGPLPEMHPFPKAPARGARRVTLEEKLRQERQIGKEIRFTLSNKCIY